MWNGSSSPLLFVTSIYEGLYLISTVALSQKSVSLVKCEDCFAIMFFNFMITKETLTPTLSQLLNKIQYNDYEIHFPISYIYADIVLFNL